MSKCEELTPSELEELERLAEESGDIGKIGRAWLNLEEREGGAE